MKTKERKRRKLSGSISSWPGSAAFGAGESWAGGEIPASTAAEKRKREKWRISSEKPASASKSQLK